MARRYRRNLPHVIPEGVPIFVTWSLRGAIPAEVRARIEEERMCLESLPPRDGEDRWDRKLREEKQLLVMTDQHLDSTSEGPMHLKDAAAAAIVENELRSAAKERCELFAWCVMANHVHALMKPRIEWGDLMQKIKGASAYHINLLQGAQGRIFWQEESYDHWVRTEDSFFRIIEYIERNPVVARLCAQPQDWSWSSARFRKNWPLDQAFNDAYHRL